MVVKRLFDDEKVQERPFKHLRQLDYSNKLYQLNEVVLEKPDVGGEDTDDFSGSECEGGYKDDTYFENIDQNEKNFKTNASFSWVATGSCDENSRSGATTLSSISQEYSELDFPYRICTPVDDDYYVLMDCSPRKQVPIGPDHQADIPVWGTHVMKKNLDQSCPYQSSYRMDDNEEEKRIGNCLTPMPDSRILGTKDQKVGKGMKDCLCLDRGSIRCARQHIMKAREEVIETIGYENFVKLGFCEMGEEVARKWTEEEEDLFHEVVFSNPVSLGRNFWKHLKAELPSRTMKDLVSYYFNVFILRRRTVQNRSKNLDIDSDDDEWHESYEDCFVVHGPEEDEDSAIESLYHQDVEADHKRGFPLADKDQEEENNDDDDGDGCEDDVGDYIADATKEDAGDDYSFDPAIRHVDNVSCNTEDDSCTSFESQSNTLESCGYVVTGPSILAMEEMGDLGKCWENKLDGCNDHCSLVDQLYLFDDCDTRIPTASAKGVDFLPTCNIIEEIFGHDTWNNPAGTK